MRILKFAVALTLAVLSVTTAQSQSYPTRPITVIVPFPAGGPTDTIARIMADHMKGTLGQSLVIENITGAGSTIGTGRLIARGARRLHLDCRQLEQPRRRRRALSGELAHRER